MKAKDLIKELEKHPDWEVSVSIDISTTEDSDRRIFGNDCIEVMNETNRNQFTICFNGYDNIAIT